MEEERKLAKLLLEGDDVQNEHGMPLRSSADGHRNDRRRGVPLIGKGIAGGQNPLSVLIAREERRRR